jgi:hypothetical protein
MIALINYLMKLVLLLMNQISLVDIMDLLTMKASH